MVAASNRERLTSTTKEYIGVLAKSAAVQHCEAMHADADIMSAPPAAAPQQACSTQITSSSGAKSDHSASRYYAAFLAFVLVFSAALGCFHVHLVLEAAATITVTFTGAAAL